MNVYTYSEARQNLASVLDEAEREGEVRITRRDGRTFSLRPTPSGSPFDDVDPITGTGTTIDDINEWVREGRERGGLSSSDA
jgi:antitoxin (DNA-binding transcriptional repressor) of toxin-antitoxin stability system